ncbi:MAG: DUF2497 domain-containing protein [Alphaproteobacteria bacterium]
MSDEKPQSDQESQEPEPTMEEILASIRRIIADDDQSNAKVASGEGADAIEAPASGEEEEDSGDDVLDLIEKVDDPVDSKDEEGEPSPVEEPQAELEPEAESEDAASAGEEEPVLEDAGEEAPSDEPEPDEQPAEAEPASPGDDESIISAAAAAAASGTFAELAKAMDREPETVGNMALGSGNSLEDLVKEMVRPMLKEWLDRNLPALVKHLVRKEIQRMVSRAEDI